MWIIQGDLLISVPDSAPLPPGSTRVDPPPAFHEDPRGFMVRDGALVPVKRPARKPALQLTQSDIAKIKAAIKAGVL